MYIHERDNWTDFTWNQAELVNLLAEVRHMQGRLLGRMQALGFQLQKEAYLETLTQDITKTSEIEGENLNLHQVRSSIAKRLGMDIGGTTQIDRNVEGIVEVMLDATGNFDKPLTKKRLYSWHGALFPTGRSGMFKISVAKWRDDSKGPMQIISGPIGNEKIHFEAPSHEKLETEMRHFIKWVESKPKIDPVIKSAIAHFWFVTIHPFDDGNGRIARAIADMILARSENTSQRFYSMSAQILRERKDYYEVLEKCSKGTSDITLWIKWFLSCLKRAISASDQTLEAVLTKAKFWEAHLGESLNDRQRKIINRLLDGFEGKLTSSKWAKLAKCSQDTALRDITDLLARKILIKEDAGGRSTGYKLTF